jgi:hypothetical protein
MKKYDHLGTTKLYSLPTVGTIVRNDGYGSRLMRVVEIIKDQVLLETYGTLEYGNITHAVTPRRITAKLFQRYDGSYYINSRDHRDRGGSYTPCEIISKWKDYPTGLEHSPYYARLLQHQQAWADGPYGRII